MEKQSLKHKINLGKNQSDIVKSTFELRKVLFASIRN